MEPRGFINALFDFSFTTFVTPKIIKVLYVLATIMISLLTLVLVLAAFRSSSASGVLMLVIGGPLFFLLAMIYARVLLELVIVFFRINGNVQELRDGRSGGALPPAPAPESPAEDATALVPADPPSSSALESASVRFCENCGAERRPDGRFCTSCGLA